MIGMSTRKDPKKSEQKKRPKGRARDRGEVRLFTMEIPLDLDEQLERCCHDQRRTKRATVIMALEAFLEQEGFREPPPSSPGKEPG